MSGALWARWCWKSSSRTAPLRQLHLRSRMAEREAEIIAVPVRLPETLGYDAATWAVLRRRMLAKAVEYNEVVLARLRARLDEVATTQSASAPPDATSPWEPDSPRNGETPQPRESAWLPPGLSPSQQPPNGTEQPRALAEGHLEWPGPSHERRSAHRVKRSETVSRKRKGRRLLMAVGLILLLTIAIAGGALLLLHHNRSSTSPVTARPSAAAQAFALPVLRHNRPRHLSIVLTRMALIARASVARTAGAAVAPQSGRLTSSPRGQVDAARAPGAAR